VRQAFDVHGNGDKAHDGVGSIPWELLFIRLAILHQAVHHMSVFKTRYLTYIQQAFERRGSAKYRRASALLAEFRQPVECYMPSIKSISGSGVTRDRSELGGTTGIGFPDRIRWASVCV
jgi:hypothetical protein